MSRGSAGSSPAWTERAGTRLCSSTDRATSGSPVSSPRVLLASQPGASMTTVFPEPGAASGADHGAACLPPLPGSVQQASPTVTKAERARHLINHVTGTTEPFSLSGFRPPAPLPWLTNTHGEATVASAVPPQTPWAFAPPDTALAGPTSSAEACREAAPLTWTVMLE